MELLLRLSGKSQGLLRDRKSGAAAEATRRRKLRIEKTMFKAGYYLPPTMTFSEFLGLIGQIVNHLANEYVYRNRCLYII